MSIPNVLSIAGSDPSGGAGVQADLKTFAALGAYGTAVLTALTAQNTRGVTHTHTVPADFVSAQLTTLLDDVAIDSIKIGMLARADTVRAVTDVIRTLPRVPVVLDPVMVATSGHRLLDADAVSAVRELATVAALITPNLAEAGVLLDLPPAADEPTMREHARRLVAAGAPRVLLKGGHLGPASDAVDVYADADGTHEFTAARVVTRNTHGTGCTLSSAIAALRPQRVSWLEAIGDAKAYLGRAIAASDQLAVGHGAGPVHHFVDLSR
jgi:hydroxymethylpyrimidine/phosphomethylpyrimidine kinase